MKKYCSLLVLALIFIALGCSKKRDGVPTVLVFSKTEAFRHESIPDGIAAIRDLGLNHNFKVEATEDAAIFENDSLERFSAIIFLNTTGNILDTKQEAAFERYIQAGGGFVGIHAATDTEYDWNWYGRLVGAYFESHPPGVQQADFLVQDTEFIATEFLKDKRWQRTDELYNFKKINPDINVLLTVDESTYEGGTNGDHHPMSWYHEYDGGRAFYTAMGHTPETYKEADFLKHLLGGIQYAIGENHRLDYRNARTGIPPDSDRFSKVSLVQGKFYEPTEMTILPNRDVLIAQRRGEILHYNEQNGELKQVALLDVYHKTLNTPGVNAEEGVMGIQKDPDYSNNHWVYVYYAPTGAEEVNRLSRFKFLDGNFDLDSEQVILDVHSDREICCHTGGSIAFDSEGLLYLSTGDNSTPFNENGVPYVNSGYAPLNDIPGHEQYDARRSSGNTNDLRGKILRIKVEEDGSYSIPEGNLFAEGTAKTRPEIYTMGHRNPYRIAVDPKTGYLYWGDVGPDARVDSLSSRGPMGHDEMNQARGPGNFGWPLFIADNKPYVDYDYSSGKSGAAFNPQLPVNDSRNNTGLRELPEAEAAFVYYPYAATAEFPQVGSGGRNAMAGPSFYRDIYPESESVPDYYDGKVLMYEWMRGWIMAMSFFEDGSFNKMEPLAPEVELNNLIDMEFSDDGRLYLLEYGTAWFSQNEDSGLSYLEFNGGNRPPVIDNFIVDHTSGATPLSVVAKVEARDREGDEITFTWDLGEGTTKVTSIPEVSHTYTNPGSYPLSVTVEDESGEKVISQVARVVAGNARPQLAIDMAGGNTSFFVPGVPLSYSVKVNDPDGKDPVDPGKVFVSVDYQESLDQVTKSLGHLENSAAVTGKALALSMDCRACHKEIEASIGPSYLKIAEKYKGSDNALAYLQEKIVEGGTGVWGEVTMPAHPDISANESRQIALYIQSLVGEGMASKKSLPPSGTLIPKPQQGANVMIITASYTDDGGQAAQPLTGIASVTLRGSTVPFSKDTPNNGMMAVNFGGMDLLVLTGEAGWFALKGIDLTGVSKAYITAGWQEAPDQEIAFEARLGSPEGELLGNGTMPKPSNGQPGGMIPVIFEKSIQGQHDLFFIYKPQATEGPVQTPVGLMNVRFDSR